MVGARFVLLYLKDGRPVLRVFNKKGRLTYEPTLPDAGFVWGSSISGPRQGPEILYQFLGLTSINTVYRLDVEKKRNTIFHEPKLTFDRNSVVVDQVFYSSKDGTRVPMFVAHKRGIKLDGNNPTFMYGYGALGWVSFIWYQPFVLSWLEMGGIYAQPSIRGGGDYGEAWHQAGIKVHKQNTIDDYIAAAEWLIQKRYTSSSRLVANDGSASGTDDEWLGIDNDPHKSKKTIVQKLVATAGSCEPRSEKLLRFATDEFTSDQSPWFGLGRVVCARKS